MTHDEFDHQAETDEWRRYVSAKLKIGDSRMDGLRDDMAVMSEQIGLNSAATSRIESNTAEMLEVFDSWSGAMRALEMIGKLAKPLSYILGVVAAVAAIWTALKTGGR